MSGSLTAGDVGVAGAYIYADIDGDNAPDTPEPFGITDANGFYTIDLTGFEGRSFAIREVQQPGIDPVFPLPITPALPLPAGFSPQHRSGEYLVTFNGGPLGDGFNFGGRVASDFSDAPASYGTASHVLTAGLTIGATVDAESAVFNTAGANGDDLDGIDDEDGVVPILPLVPGSTGAIDVSTVNSTGAAAFLQGWVDFNGDGDFADAGEQIAIDRQVGTGTTRINFPVPAGAVLGTTISRFRYSRTAGLGATGAAGSGEVEDTQILISANANVLNPDTFSVNSNSTSNPLDVLANDLSPATAPLNIPATGLNLTGTRGTATVVDNGGPTGQDIIRFTPAAGFIGTTTFTYTAVDALGVTRGPATVTVNVGIGAPTAVDDIFRFSDQASPTDPFRILATSNVPLNVLGNDLGPTEQRSIVSITQPTTGGQVRIDSADDTIIYNPGPNSPDTEQFTYQIQALNSDDVLQLSNPATVTVTRVPQSFANDTVALNVAVLNPDTNAPISTIRAGEEFLVRISVDDLRDLPAAQQGVFSAALDLLYTSELVNVVGDPGSPGFNFAATVGPIFANGSALTGNIGVPGLINEIGAVQQTNNVQNFSGSAELLTIRFTAVNPGEARFDADPAESLPAEVTLVGVGAEEPNNRIRFGFAPLTILPAGAALPVAVDDAFSGGVDSLGIPFAGDTQARLNVLANDSLDGGTLQSFTIISGPSEGTAVVNNNGTPGNLADDFVTYTPTATGTGFDSFQYAIVVGNEFGTMRSVANVTLRNGEIENPLAGYELFLTDGLGNRIDRPIRVGERFGVEIEARDLTRLPDIDTAFAGFLDLLYDPAFVTPANTPAFGNDNFTFDVIFNQQFNSQSAVGVNNTPGLIDEFGSLLADSIDSDIIDIISGGQVDIVRDVDNNTLATIFFNAGAVGPTSISSSPADVSPFQDTLLFQRDQPVPISQIVYDQLNITITAGSGEPLHNASLPQDVNADGAVSAIDALLIINELGRLDAQGETSVSGGSLRFVDVNNDGKASAIDALRVINYLNAHSGNGEPIAAAVAAAEPIVVASGTVAVPVGSDASPVGSPVDQVASETLGSSAKVVGGSSGVMDPNRTTGGESDFDTGSDEDDVLSLLADDVAGVWA